MKKNENYKWIVGFIIGVLLAIPLVYAVTTYASSDVYYNNSGSSLASADVEGAID